MVEQIEKSKNRELLDSFIHYCENAPQERFWQAIRNWWRYQNPHVNFILWAEDLDFKTGRFINIIDSFYSEDKITRDEKDKYYEKHDK